MKNLTNAGFANPNENFAATFNPFKNFDFSKFQTFNSFSSAEKKFSADNFLGDEAGTVEFFFFSPITEEVFNEFKDFVSKEVFPKVKANSFLKFNFFNNDDFEFGKFNEFFNRFAAKGLFFEMSFFTFPDDFSFSEFGFPFGFNGDFMFSVSQTSFR